MHRHLNMHIAACAGAMRLLGLAFPGTASARRLWNQGQGVHPRLAPCAREKAAEDGAFMSWDRCMGGQINPPSNTNAAARYWLRRRKCQRRYTMFTNAKHRYRACEARLRHHR